MKNSIIILTIIFCLFAGCKNTENENQSDQPKSSLIRPKIKGIYLIGSIGMTPEFMSDKLQAKKFLEFGDKHFNFQENDTVLLSKECGEKLFQDTVFRYEISRKLIVFTSGDRRIEMPYVNDYGIIRIDIDNEYLTRIDLVPPQH